jgi:hypothetical protein
MGGLPAKVHSKLRFQLECGLTSFGVAKKWPPEPSRFGGRVARWFVFKPRVLIWVNLGGPWIEKVGILCGHLKYITAIRYILWQLGSLVAIWYIFSRFGLLCKEKSGNPVRAFWKEMKSEDKT